MRKMIYLDCSTGVAGDMLVSSLIDLGADLDKIKDTFSPLAEIKSEKTEKGLRLQLELSSHSNQYSDLTKTISDLPLSPIVETTSQKILKKLAIAESKVHDNSLEEVHLHEAIDCIVDAVAFSLALEDLKLLNKKITASLVGVGELAPATREIIKTNSIPIQHVSKKEIATPTGIAILAAVVNEFLPDYRSFCSRDFKNFSKVGKGIGNKHFGSVVKAKINQNHAHTNDKKQKQNQKNKKNSDIIFESTNSLVMLETNIDDSTPEEISYLISQIMEEDALDVTVSPVTMKKGRPGFLVRVITKEPEKHAKLLIQESSTLGVREIPITRRFKAHREIKQKKIKINGHQEKIRVKKTPHGTKPEFDDLQKLTRKYSLPFSKIKQMVKKQI